MSNEKQNTTLLTSRITEDLLPVLYRANLWMEILDTDCNITFLNERAELQSGYPNEKFLGNDHQWEVLFREKQAGLRMKKICRDMMHIGREFEGKIARICTAGQKERIMSWSMTLITNEKHRVSGCLLMGVDVTDYKNNIEMARRSEDKYRTIFDQAPLGFFRSLPEGKFLEVNTTFAKMLGYNTPMEVLENVKDIANDIYSTPESRPKIIDHILQSGKTESFETALLRKNCGSFDVRLNIRARTDREMKGPVLEGTVEEITERKKTEKQLRENLLKYATLFDKSPISHWELDFSEARKLLKQLHESGIEDLEGYLQNNIKEINRLRESIRILDINQATLDMFEAKYKDELIDYWKESLKSETGQIELESLKAIIRGQKSFSAEAKYKTLKGNRRETMVRWVVADSGEPYSRVLVSMEDITSQKIEKEALAASESQLSMLLSAMDDVVLRTGRDGTIRYLAPTATDAWFGGLELKTGSKITEYVDDHSAQLFLQKINECLEANATVKFDFNIILDGKTSWYDIKLSPVSKTDVIWVARDITDRVKSLQVNKVMLNIARAVNIVENLDDLFENIRNEISKLIDTKNFFIALYDKITNTLSLPYFRDEKDKFDRFPAEKTLSSLVLEEKKSMLLNIAEIRKLNDEGKINMVGSASKVWMGVPLMVEGDVVGIMVVQNYHREDAFSRDDLKFLEVISPQISLSIKRKQSEQLIKESERQLRQSNLTKDRFFNIIAHDLKNPFNAIIGFSNLLLDDWNEFGDPDKISMINSIRSSSEGAYDLLMNLLEWSRLQVGKIHFNPEFTDLSSLVELNFSLLRTSAEGKNIVLKTGRKCDRLVWVDANMINTVLRNLISNAIKFTRKGGQVSVECIKDPDNPDLIRMSVSDSGVGIAESELPKLFDIASTKTGVGTAGETGTGLGLILCKEFVEKNKGNIRVKSQQGVGSTFYVTLPVRPR